MLLSALISLFTLVVIIAILVDRRRLASVAGAGVADHLPASGFTSAPMRQLLSKPGNLTDRIHLSRRLSLVAFVGSLVLLLWGQWRLVTGGPDRSTVVMWLLGLAGIAGLAMLATAPRARSQEVQDERTASVSLRVTQINYVRLILTIWSVVSSIAVWRLTGPRGSADHVTDVTILWISAMISLVLAVSGPPSRLSLRRSWSSLAKHRMEVLIVSAIVLFALMLRVFPFGSYPRSMSGDEGVFAMQALDVIDGKLNNHFAVGIMGNINLWFASLAGMMSVFGETVGGSRLLSGLFGALAVLPTYMLARKHFDSSTATLAAIILAVSHLALFWSRNTMNNVSALFFVPLALWLLDAGLLDRRSVPAVLAGMAIGLSMMFYVSNRILVPIAAVYAGYAVFARYPRSRRDLYQSIRGFTPFAALGIAGFVVAAMPILSHFRHHPGSFNSRINQVSVFASGWLDRETDLRGESAIRILAGHFRDVALLPFGDQVTGTILHPDPPLLGWPLVVPTAIGLSIATLTFWRRSHVGLAVGFWATAAGMAITIGPTEPHKLVTAVSIIAIFAAVGMVALTRILLDLIRSPKLLVAASVTAMALFVVLWNLNYYFQDPDRDADFSDPSTQIAQSMAGVAAGLGPDATVYFLGAPWMYYGGFKNIEFIARDAEGVDIIDPLNASSTPPVLRGPTLFAVLGGRESELEIIRSWFPGGKETRHTWTEWGYLYTTYLVDPAGSDEP